MPKTYKPHNEKDHQIEAYLYWRSLGDRRTNKEVSEKFQVTQASICNWRKWFNWNQRLDEAEGRIHDKIEAELDRTVAEKKVEWITMLHHALSKAELKIQNGQLKIKDMSDVDRVIKLSLLLHGDPTEHRRITIETLGVVVNYIVLTVQKHVIDPEILDAIRQDLETQVKQIPKEVTNIPAEVF